MFQKIKPLWSRMGLLAAAAFLAMSGATAQPGVPAQQRPMVLEGGTLIDGTGKAPIPDAVVVVQGTRITAVGRRGQVTVPANANVINLTGRTILPGLIDIHVHSNEWHPPMFLHYGVTTIQDLNTDTTWVLAQREMSRNGKIKGPRMFVSGTYVFGLGKPLCDGYVPPNTPPYHAADGSPSVTCNEGTFNTPPLGTVEETRAYVRSLVALGVDNIKTDDTITEDQLHAVIEEAKAAGIPTIGHTENIRKAAEMGFKFEEHMDTMARALLDPEDKIPARLWPSRGGPAPPGLPYESRVDPKQFPALIDYLVKQGVYLNPTLVGTWSTSTPRGQDFAKEGAELAKDPELAFVPAYVRKKWGQPPAGPRAGYANIAEYIREYSQAGGKVVVGTDAHNGNTTIPGLATHREMQMLADIGIPPMKIIQGATLWNAEVIKKDKDLGSIEPGKLADFTIIEGDPLANISATRNVRMVIKDGKVVDTAYDPKWVNPIPEPFVMCNCGPPQITKLSPAVVRQGGQTVTLQVEGSMFTPNTFVRFDNADLPTQFVSSTKLTATLDARLLQRKPGLYVLYVVEPGLHGTISSAGYEVIDTASTPVNTIPEPYNVYASDPPQIFGPINSRVARQGGQTVTLQIEGTKFTPNAIVHFDTAELPTHFVSSTKLTATLDARLLQRRPGAYVFYVVNTGEHGTVSFPAYFLVNMKG